VPIYEYRCESCEHRLEKLQKMSEGDLVDCPECKRPTLKRLVSAAAFRLKGGGWYETDFKQDNKRNLAESSSAETSGRSSSDHGSSDKSSSDKSSSDKSSSDTKSAVGDSKKSDASSTESSVTKTETKPAAKPAAKE